MFADSNGRDGHTPNTFGRRAFFVTFSAALAGLVFWRYEKNQSNHVEAAPVGPPKQVTIVEFTDAGERKDVVSVPMIQKTDAEWKKLLSPLSLR
jgi:hypothetical protein